MIPHDCEFWIGLVLLLSLLLFQAWHGRYWGKRLAHTVIFGMLNVSRAAKGLSPIPDKEWERLLKDKKKHV